MRFVLFAPFGCLVLASLSACTPPPEPKAQPCPPAVAPPKPVVALPKAEANEPRTLEVRLSPVREAAEVSALDVTLRFSVPPVDFGETSTLTFRIGESAGAAVEELAARDSEGSLALRHEESQPIWRAERRARGPVTLSYRAHLPTKGRSNADLMAGSHWFIALGRGFLLLPETTEPHAIRVQWELGSLGEGARGISSLPTSEREWVGAPSALGTTIWAAGELRHVSIELSGLRERSILDFRATTLGDSMSGFADMAPWAAKFWRESQRAVASAPVDDLHLFVQSNASETMELRPKLWGRHALAMVNGRGSFGALERRTLARALLRQSLGSSAEGQAWFDEGLVTYAMLDVMQRAGLGTNAEILSELIARTERYWGSPHRAKPLSELMEKAAPGMAEQMEDRGFLFAAAVDAAVKKASGGKRSLQDVLRELGPKPATEEEAERAPRMISIAAFRDVLVKELGEAAFGKPEAMLKTGASVELDDDTFGTCFEKAKKKIPLLVEAPASTDRKASKAPQPVDGFSWTWAKKAPATCGAKK